MYLFAFTLFLSAALLFIIQLLFARLVLPLLGGSPAVWNTCMVFFQAALLAGYAYAHESATRLPLRRHVPVHLIVLLVPLVVLPIRLMGGAPPRDANPIQWLLLIMAASVGLPFLAVSTTSSILQRWFSATDHPQADDPYFLYAASNLGSIAGLAGYVVLIEPALTLGQQRWAWSAGYVLLLLLIGACGWRTIRSARPEPATVDEKPAGDPDTIPLRRKLRWILLAFVPSSLMLGITNYLTTDIAAVPLLWVIPLGLYLVSFMLVFSSRQWLTTRQYSYVLPVLVLIQAVVLARVKLPLEAMVPLHLTTFFAAAMACHGLLAADRPPARHLTSFYLMLSLGGVLGGVFNALIAPVIFDAVTEYPVVLVLACAVLPGWRIPWKRRRAIDPGAPSQPGALSLPMMVAIDVLWFLALTGLVMALPVISRQFEIKANNINYLWMMSVVAVLCAMALGRSVRFALGLGGVLLGMSILTQQNSTVGYQERTFYGVLRITTDARNAFVTLSHGTTMHGKQATSPALARLPLTYYHPTGPIGQVFGQFRGKPLLERVGVVGLGAGSLAGYTGRGQHMTFYEIDPAVVRLATDPRAFTYITDARERGAEIDIILGDARLRLADSEDQAHSLIVLDAFSSDAIPTHLVTREALHLYLRKLRPGGLLAFHVSNRLLDLEPVLARLAQDAGLVAYARHDSTVTDRERMEGKSISRWVLLARRTEDLGPLAKNLEWKPLEPSPDVRVWTDDYSNILDVLRLKP